MTRINDSFFFESESLSKLLFFSHKLWKTKSHLFCNRFLYFHQAIYPFNVDISTFYQTCKHLDIFGGLYEVSITL